MNQDSAINGTNGFSYGGNDPVNRMDSDGKSWFDTYMLNGIVALFVALTIIIYIAASAPRGPYLTVEVELLCYAACMFASAYGCLNGPSDDQKQWMNLGTATLALAAGIVIGLNFAKKLANAVGAATVTLCALYDTVLLGLLIDIQRGK